MTQGKTGFLGWYFSINILKRIMFATIAGGILGVVLAYISPATGSSFAADTKFFGDLFVRLLQMIVVPTIFFSVITGVSSITPAQLGRVGLKTLAYYLGWTLIAICIGLLLANLFQPGQGLNLAGVANAEGKTAATPGMTTILLNIIPSNPVNALAQGQLLPILFFALIFGISLSVVRHTTELAQAGDTLYLICSACAETMYKIVGGVMQYSPIGVFFLISGLFATQGPKVIGSMFFVLGVTFLAFLLHFTLSFGGMLAIHRLSYRKFLRGAEEAIITAFVTRSSNATLPISLRVTEQNLGVPRSITSFSLPIGATINMDGTAIYLSICTMFIGFAVGKPLTMDQQLTVVLMATLGAIGSAGVPGAGAIMLLVVLDGVGLKVEAGSAVAAAYAMMLGIDALMDMGRTCLNVTGDLTTAVVVANHEKVLDMSKW